MWCGDRAIVHVHNPPFLPRFNFTLSLCPAVTFLPSLHSCFPSSETDIMATEHNAQVRSTGSSGDPLEKDFSSHNGNGTNGSFNPSNQSSANPYHMSDMNLDNDAALKRIRTAGSISISPELFEKIYLSPQNAVKGDLRKTFGNPTPV